MAQQGLGVPSAQSLAGLRVLVVEDEFYIADDVQRVLKASGAIVIGPVSTVEKAQQALDRGGFDCVILDLNLHGESGAPIADSLLEMGTPFAIATGYGSGSVPERLQSVVRCEKPFDPQDLARVVSRLCRQELPAGSPRILS